MTAVLGRIKEALDALGYRKSGKGALRPKILHRIERLIGRAGLTHRDKAMIEGLMARITQNMAKK
jgi:tRNA C32,U32 (ribose-2'-O)-methylase TrmJ